MIQYFLVGIIFGSVLGALFETRYHRGEIRRLFRTMGLMQRLLNLLVKLYGDDSRVQEYVDQIAEETQSFLQKS